jgi:hypothetical protein
MLSADRRVALETRLANVVYDEQPMYKQATIEKVAEFRNYYGWMWPMALEKEAAAAGNDELTKIAQMEKEALLARLGLRALGALRTAGGAAKSTVGRGLARFGRAGGKADLAGQRMIRAGQQTKALGAANKATAAASKSIGLSPAMARVIQGTSKASLRSGAAKAGTQTAKGITKKITGARAAASRKAGLLDKARAKGLVPGQTGAQRAFAKNTGDKKIIRQLVATQGKKPGSNIVRDIYGRSTAHAAQRGGIAGATQKGLEAALSAPGAARKWGAGLKRMFGGRNWAAEAAKLT